VAKATSLKYHAQALRLLGREPERSAKAVLAVRACEEVCGIRLPAAVREWYTLKGAVEMLAAQDGACGPNSLEGLLDAFVTVASTPKGRPPPRIQFYGPWRTNTGYDADLVLNGSDDPPIIDSEPTKKLFSKYVLDMAWWKTTMDGAPGIHIAGQDWWDFAARCGPTHLTFFTDQFEELPREAHPYLTWAAGRPDLLGFRFFREGWRVAVATKGDPLAGDQPAAYDLHADTEEELFRLYKFVRLCHGVPLHLPPSKPTPNEDMKVRFLTRFPSAEVCGQPGASRA
jgi:hypothetical protein